MTPTVILCFFLLHFICRAVRNNKVLHKAAIPHAVNQTEWSKPYMMLHNLITKSSSICFTLQKVHIDFNFFELLETEPSCKRRKCACSNRVFYGLTSSYTTHKSCLSSPSITLARHITQVSLFCHFPHLVVLFYRKTLLQELIISTIL